MNQIAFYHIDTFLAACKLLVEAQSNFAVTHLTDGSYMIETQNCQVGELLEAQGRDGATYFERI